MILVSFINGAPGFGPVPRSTIEERGKAKYGTGQKSLLHAGDKTLDPIMDERYFRYFKQI